jgi:hypothetical protein
MFSLAPDDAKSRAIAAILLVFPFFFAYNRPV